MKSWAVPAAFIVALQWAFALAIGFSVGFSFRLNLAAPMVLTAFVVVLSLPLFLAFRLAQSLRYGDAPFEIVRYRNYCIGAALVCLQMSVLNWTKITLPLATNFWADPFLVDLDAAMFFQTDPWRITHALFGWASIPLDWLYVAWAPLQFAVIILLFFAPESERKTRCIFAYFLMFALCSVGQYLLPSAGPIFYERLGLGGRFSDIPVLPWVATASDYLWQDFLSNGGSVGSGISAMPSVHVAVALWMAVVIRAYVPKLSAVGFGYFALILIGSVHLGWHYAVDGLASIVIVFAAFRAPLALRSRQWMTLAIR